MELTRHGFTIIHVPGNWRVSRNIAGLQRLVRTFNIDSPAPSDPIGLRLIHASKSLEPKRGGCAYLPENRYRLHHKNCFSDHSADHRSV